MTNTRPRLGTVYYRVPRERFDEFARFFGEQLGLDTKFRDGADWIAFDAGGVTLALEGADGGEWEGPLLALRVEDAEAVRADLERHDVPVTAVVVGGHERRFHLHAPWGERLSAHQPGTGR